MYLFTYTYLYSTFSTSFIFQGWGMCDNEHAYVFVDNHDNQRGHGGGGNILVCRQSYTVVIR